MATGEYGSAVVVTELAARSAAAEGEGEGEGKGEGDAEAGPPRWEVTYNAKEPLLDLQWAPWEEVRWERVLEGSLVANHYYCRRGVVRRVELYMALMKRAETQQYRPHSDDAATVAMLPTVSLSSAAAADPARAAPVADFLRRAGGGDGALWRATAQMAAETTASGDGGGEGGDDRVSSSGEFVGDAEAVLRTVAARGAGGAAQWVLQLCPGEAGETVKETGESRAQKREGWTAIVHVLAVGNLDVFVHRRVCVRDDEGDRLVDAEVVVEQAGSEAGPQAHWGPDQTQQLDGARPSLLKPDVRLTSEDEECRERVALMSLWGRNPSSRNGTRGVRGQPGRSPPLPALPQLLRALLLPRRRRRPRARAAVAGEAAAPIPCARVDASVEHSIVILIVTVIVIVIVIVPMRTRDIACCAVFTCLLKGLQLVVLVSSQASVCCLSVSPQITAASKDGEPVPDVVLRDTLHVVLPLCESPRHPDGGGSAHVDASERELEVASGFRRVEVTHHAAQETSKEASAAK